MVSSVHQSDGANIHAPAGAPRCNNVALSGSAEPPTSQHCTVACDDAIG